MKVIALTTAAVLVAGNVFAGALTYEEPAVEEEVMMEEEKGSSMGGSGGWILPLVALAVIVAVASN